MPLPPRSAHRTAETAETTARASTTPKGFDRRLTVPHHKRERFMTGNDMAMAPVCLSAGALPPHDGLRVGRAASPGGGQPGQRTSTTLARNWRSEKGFSSRWMPSSSTPCRSPIRAGRSQTCKGPVLPAAVATSVPRPPDRASQHKRQSVSSRSIGPSVVSGELQRLRDRCSPQSRRNHCLVGDPCGDIAHRLFILDHQDRLPTVCVPGLGQYVRWPRPADPWRARAR